MSREINLDGMEISIIKALGFGSGEISGEALIGLVADLEEAELVDTLKGLMVMGYVSADKNSFRAGDEFRATNFHVNSGYSRELKDALNPSAREKPKSRRVRRE